MQSDPGNASGKNQSGQQSGRAGRSFHRRIKDGARSGTSDFDGAEAGGGFLAQATYSDRGRPREYRHGDEQIAET
jgi:hypothetical protein